MDRRRIAFTLGTAAGGLLGAAFLPVTVAVADEFDYTNYDLQSVGSEVVSDGGIRNFLAQVPPAAEGSVQGTQEFTVIDPSTDGDVGTINADVTTTSGLLGGSNELIYVTSDASGTGDPPVGSVFDTDTLGDGYSSVYSDIPTADGNEITYTLDTPSGDFNIPTTYNALAVTPVTFTGDSALGGDTFTLDGDETIAGVNGIPAADYDVLGTQGFTVTNGDADLGTITTDVANSSDIFGNTTQDILVTSSTDSSLPAGTVIDYFYSADGSENVYTDIPEGNGTYDITDTIVTKDGDYTLPTDFNAAAEVAAFEDGTTSAIDTSSYDVTPDGTGTIVAIDGIQPEDVDVQGVQEFDYANLATSQTGTFDADVADSSFIFGTTQEQLVVTQDVSGNAPAAGSVFEVDNFGNGYQLVYSDLVGAGSNGGNEITETLVTPFGDINIPDNYDASAALAGDSFQNVLDPGTNASIAADLANILDPSAAAAVDPSAGLDAGSLIDPGAHIDALVNLLTGLF